MKADKWLFDVVQPWMEKTRSILALEDLFSLTVRLWRDNPSRIFYVLQEYSIKVNYKKE
jgi:hypothetical protein